MELASTASLVGAVLGQLTFGFVGDCIGRTSALRLTMAYPTRHSNFPGRGLTLQLSVLCIAGANDPVTGYR